MTEGHIRLTRCEGIVTGHASVTKNSQRSARTIVLIRRGNARETSALPFGKNPASTSKSKAHVFLW
jgi:hypothetical protein